MFSGLDSSIGVEGEFEWKNAREDNRGKERRGPNGETEQRILQEIWERGGKEITNEEVWHPQTDIQ